MDERKQGQKGRHAWSEHEKIEHRKLFGKVLNVWQNAKPNDD